MAHFAHPLHPPCLYLYIYVDITVDTLIYSSETKLFSLTHKICRNYAEKRIHKEKYVCVLCPQKALALCVYKIMPG
jgi:hypothetical protein